MRACHQCGTPLVRKKYPRSVECRSVFNRRKYCDQRCMAAAYEGRVKVENPKNGRRQSAKKRKALCELCKKPAHHVHHRDENPVNNADSNLQSLCASCHSRSHSPSYTETLERRNTCAHCEKPSYRRDLCSTHLSRLKRHGHPLAKKIKTGLDWHLVILPGN